MCFVDNWSVRGAETGEFSVEDTKINWVVGYNSSSKYRISTARKYFMTEFPSSAATLFRNNRSLVSGTREFMAEDLSSIEQRRGGS